MKQLSAKQSELLESLVARLRAVPGVAALALGGSHARGRARPDSDLDIGVYYEDTAPLELETLRSLARAVDDSHDPVVTAPYEWGPWVNGGAWLSVGGQRVDLLYKSLEFLERVVLEAEAGRFELHWGQQAPFGFFGPTLLGELAIALPLHDPKQRLAALKRRVSPYPEALRASVVQTYLWAVEFNLESFARKFAARGDVVDTAGCLTRAVHQLVLVLFALNRTYLLNDKTALAEIADFAAAPRDFGARVSALLGAVGATPAELGASVEALAALFRETVAHAHGLYAAKYRPPK
jgi:predicted nucleotidyltransferase